VELAVACSEQQAELQPQLALPDELLELLLEPLVLVAPPLPPPLANSDSQTPFTPQVWPAGQLALVWHGML